MNSIIEEMKRQQDATGTGPDPVIEQMRALNQSQHAQAALAVSMQSNENADVAARHAQLAKRYNTTPEVVAAYPQEFKDRMALEMARANLADAPKLQQAIGANPNTGAIIHDDLPNASAIERTVKPVQYMSEWRQPEQGETIRERMSNYWRSLFGVQSVQEEARGKREAEANAILAGRRGNPDLTDDQAFEVSRKAVGGMSPAAQIAAERFIDSASFGLVAPVNQTKAHSWQQSVAGAGGQLAGFMVGPAKAAGALINPLEKVAGESFVKGFSKSVINEAATLALATAAEKSGHALLDSTSVDQGIETMGHALEGGALMGATFGAAKKIFPDNTLPQWLARAVGVSAAQDYTEGTNPLDERVPLEDRLLKYFLNAAFTIHGGGRSEGGWLKDAAAAKVAEGDFTQLTTLGQLSTASKWRERDPEGFKNFVRSTTEDGHLATVYVDGDMFMQSMEKAGVTPQEIQKTMPDLVAQIKEATETGGMVQIPTEDYATHIAGSKLDQELLQHLKTDPEGKTYAEAQQFYQDQATKMKEAAAGLVKEKTEQDAFRTSQEAVQAKIQENLDAVNRFPSNVNRINATVQSAILSRIAMREGITPEAAFEKYGARVVGEGAGGFDQAPAPETPEFKKWFGKSQVVDAEGKPLEMYHGTGKDFDTFQKQMGRQFFFSPDPEFAAEYAKSRGGNVMPVYVKAEKVWDYENPEDLKVLQKHLKLSDEDVQLPQGFDAGEQYIAAAKGDWSYIESREFQTFLKRNGYDGFYVEDAGVKNLGVFEPNQIKSVFNKAPTDAAGILNQSARTVFDQTQTEAFKRWSNDAPFVDREQAATYDFKTGEKVVLEAYHGTGRPDRVGTSFKKSRATSGPMSFFTSDPELASSYAKGKQDTSLSYEDQNYANWFKVKPKGARTPIDIVRSWYGLDAETKAKIRERAPTLRMDEENEHVISQEGNTSGNGSYDHNLQVSARKDYTRQGNPLEALVEDWLNSGLLFDNEAKFMDVLKAAGFPMSEVNYDSPHDTFPFVYKTYIEMQKPLVAGDIPQDVVDALDQAAKRDRSRAQTGGADMWDKNTRTLRQWVEAFHGEDNKYVWTSIPDKVTAVFKSLGYDGIIDYSGKGGGHEHPVYIPFEENQVKSAIGNKGTFNDTSNILKQDARGSYMPDERAIALLKDADLSTYLHETGHWALDIYSKIATHPEASPEIRGDMDKLLKWFGVESLEKWNSMSIDEQRPHHEQLARGFEAYLMEGKAPSAELAPVFARIRSWLVNIYKSLKNLNVELTPEVRGVFDRMLASDEAIAEAQAARVFEPIFKTKPEGMTDEEWKSYSDLNEQATADAIADMQAKSLRDMKWLSGAKSRALKSLQKQADAERTKIEAEVAAQVDETPLYAAERFLRKGETRSPNGDIIQVSKEGLPGTKFNSERIKEMYPESALDRPDLAKLKGMTGPKGLDPDLIADMFGFRSGDELVRKLIDMEPRESVIEGLTDKRMLEEHGELATPQGIEAAANEAVHNDARARFIATGLKVLAKSPIPARELLRGAREAAEGAIAEKRVRDLNPRQYEAAETKANKEAIKLAAKDPAQAVQAQRASLLNNQLAKATRKAQEDVQKAIDHFKRLGKDAAQDAMRGEYLSQLNDLLARFDLRTSVKPSAEARQPLGEWVQAEAERLSAVVPDLPAWVLNEGYRTHYTELTVEQLRGLRDTVKQLEHMARREQKQYMAIRAMEFAAERGEVLDEIRKNWKDAFDEEGLPKGIEPDFVPSLKKSIGKLGDKFAGEFLNPETILSILGGGKFTVVNESLFGRLSSRSDWKAEKLESLYKELKPLFDAYSIKEKYDFARKDIATPAGVDTPLTRENALVVALLHGNADGRERLSNYGWSEAKQQQIIGLLDAKDLNLANAIWRMFDHTLWPELKKLNDDTRGKAPPKVEAVPYTTAAGEWTGGYFKLKYDTALDERVHRMDEGQAVKELLGNGYGMGAKTNQGSSTERKQEVRLRPRLDLGVFSEAVNETVHDLAYREAIADTMRMLNDKGIQNAVKQVVGIEGYRALVNRVREVAAPPRNPSGYVETAISVARRNTVINLMSGVKTALQNFTGLAPAFAEINSGTLGAEIARFYSPKMVERYEFAMEHSAYMRQRFTNYDRDLNTQIKKLTVNGSFRPDESTFLGLMGFIDKGVSVPVWNAAFKQGMEKFTNDVSKSVDYADHIVRQTQGSGRDVDLAQIMSGHGGWGQLKKAFTMFYSYFNGQLNLLTKHAVMAKLEAEEGSTAVASGKMAAKFIAIVAVPTILTELLMHGYQQDGETEEDQRLRFAGAFVKYGAGFFPFVRDIVPGIWAQATGDHFITPKISALDSAIEGVVKAGKSLGDVVKGENDERDTKNLIMGVGYLVGLPGKLISDTVEGTRQWLNGDAGPQAILLGPPKK